MPILPFKSDVLVYGNHKIIKLPDEISSQLSSRGMNFAEIRFLSNGGQPDVDAKPAYALPLEPDGNGSHWFYVPMTLHDTIIADTHFEVRLTPLEEWPSPEVPEDFVERLKLSALYDFYHDLTPKAQWEWMRWIQMTNNPSTREKRITVSMDKMHKGMKRPCCFDQTRCTDYRICSNGMLKITL